MKMINVLKEELKGMAVEIREKKYGVKEKQRSGKDAWREQGDLYSLKYDFRHKHIAYCLMRGRTCEQIEQKCREGNEPNQHLIGRLIDEYSQTEANVRSGS